MSSKQLVGQAASSSLKSKINAASGAPNSRTAFSKFDGSNVPLPAQPVMREPVENDILMRRAASIVEELIIEVKYTKGGLGMSVMSRRRSEDCDKSDLDLFVGSIDDNGPAAAAGLRLYDSIVSVNGRALRHLDHQTAVEIILSAGSTIQFYVLRTHQTIPPDFVLQVERIETQLVRDENGFGFSIAGGKSREPFDFSVNVRSPFRDAVFISRIFAAGAAEKSNKLQVGDKLVTINGFDVSDARDDHVLTLLNCKLSKLRLGFVRERLVRSSQSPSSTVPSASSSHSREVIKVQLSGKPLGLAICGGSDVNCRPFDRNGGRGVFVAAIRSDSAATRSGLRVGDRLLSMNDVSLENVTRAQAMEIIDSAKNDVTFFVQHDPQPAGLRELIIERRSLQERIGISIKGGTGERPVNAGDHDDEGVFITKLLEDGAVARDGRVQVGTRLLAVNDCSLVGVSHFTAVEILRDAGMTLRLLVCDGI